MNSQLAPLVQLQALDLRGTEIQEQRKKTPELLQQAEQALKQVTDALEKAKASADASQKARRECEQNLETHEQQMSKLKGRVTEIKKNTEYQAHLFEIQVAEKKKGEIEEQILLLMEQVEKDQEAVKAAQEQESLAKKIFEEEKRKIEDLDGKLAEEFDELEGRRALAAQAVDKALLDRYRKIKNARKDLAVVRVVDGTCAGCRLQLAPQLVAEVKRGQELLTCTFCYRMLYFDGELPGTNVPSEEVSQPSEGVSGPV